MSTALKDKRVLQGVSLANQAFDRAYFRNLFTWLKEQGIARADVIIFDVIEPINYVVFRQIPFEDARKAAAFRARQLVRMVRKVEKEAVFPVVTELESESSVRSTVLFADTLKRLHDAYGASDVFRKDVQEQIRLNLVKRREKHGDDYIEKKLDMLSEYILDELAWFYCYFKQYPDSGEVYPGPSLFVKDHFFRGKYSSDGLMERLDSIPIFTDVSFLKSE